MNSTDHAEVVRLKQLAIKAKGSTIVVTLEPCNHTGSTGPCVQADYRCGYWQPWSLPLTIPMKKAAGEQRQLRAAGITVGRWRAKG
jgi:diaminohydroxyphosphoribosylaminopyrimidine deaminase/5-amino-6-(5-phosphoribosylamino)uracil reductase